jgi:hypothetical protein
MKLKFLIVVFAFWATHSFSQVQNPPSVKWRTIDTKNFVIIFPSEIDSVAQKIANKLEWSYIQATKSLTVNPKKVPLVLNSQSLTSNAYAALGPRHMGWYLQPPPSVGSLGHGDWTSMLSIHEYRHIVQYAKNNRNFTKFMTLLFGDAGQGMMRWSIPDWFFEGDAIVMETALTKAGRGRMPEFDMHIRTLELTNQKFNYDQAYLGSYKRFYPSHYHLGYPMAAYARVNFGSDIWDKVLERTSKISFWPFAFSSSLKKYTNLNNQQLYKATFSELKQKWANDTLNRDISNVKIVNKKQKNNWTNYTYPQYDNEGNIICIKESMDKIAAFYKIMPDGSEQKLQNTAAGIFKTNGQSIVWNRNFPDYRWGGRNFSTLMIYDMVNGAKKSMFSFEKYVSPAFSPDGKHIAAVEHGVDQKTFLCILDTTNKQLVKKIQAESNDFIRTPVWSGDGQRIAFTHSGLKGLAVSVYEIDADSIIRILDYGPENIGMPVFYNDYLVYNSPYSGIGNIYAVDLKTGQKYQITSRPFGAYNASISPDKSKMIFQDYTKDGFDIAEMNLIPENWKKLEEINVSDQLYYKTLVNQEGQNSIEDATIPNEHYAVKNYKKYKDALKIHTWGIFPNTTSLQASVYSDNYLNTLSGEAGYLFNLNEQTHTGYMGFSFSKYFPVYTIVASYGQRKGTYKLTDATVNDQWDEFKSSLNIGLPFNLSRGTYFTSFTFKTGYTYTHTFSKGNIRRLSDPPLGSFHAISGGFSFSNQQRYALRDFNPRWGQFFNFDLKGVAFTANYKGFLSSVRAGLFFPGIFPQNSIRLSAAAEKQRMFLENDFKFNYYFPAMTSFPRGYKAYTYDAFQKLSVEYQLPIWFPDLHAGPLAYFKRLRAGAFIDAGKGKWGRINSEFLSVGGSLVVEFYVLRYRYPIEAGLQYSYKLRNPNGEKLHDFSLLIFGLPF